MLLQCRYPGWWTGPVGAVGHPFAAVGGMECCDRVAVGEINQRGRPRRVRGS